MFQQKSSENWRSFVIIISLKNNGEKEVENY